LNIFRDRIPEVHGDASDSCGRERARSVSGRRSRTRSRL
jgi:hypothetical protein